MKKNWKRIDGPVWVQDFNRSLRKVDDRLMWYYGKVKYDSLEEALKYLYGYTRKYRYQFDRVFEDHVVPYLIIFDECGLEIPQSILKLEFEKIKYFKKENKKRKYKFRNGPVPNIGGRCRYGDYWRDPKTFNEIKHRANDDYKEIKDKYGISIKRNTRYIPTSWDDIYRHNEKTWKKTRKTQYKMKE
jgi:hypothetical protein